MNTTQLVQAGSYEYDLVVKFPSTYIPDHTPPSLRDQAAHQTTRTRYGCGETHVGDWGFSIWHADFLPEEPQNNFDESGERIRPLVLAWAQEHAETCRALPKPDGAR